MDLAHLALRIGSDEGRQLAQTIQDCVKYNGTTITNCYGLSIYFPYESMSSVSSALNTYDTLGLDEEYAKVIRSFASLEYGGQVGSSASQSYGYSGGGFDSYGDLPQCDAPGRLLLRRQQLLRRLGLRKLRPCGRSLRRLHQFLRAVERGLYT